MPVMVGVKCSRCGVRPAEHNGRQRLFCQTCRTEVARARYAENGDVMRRQKREHAARRRRDPVKGPADRERRRLTRDRARESRTKREWLAALREQDPVRWRAFVALGHTERVVSVDDLVALWHAQAGRCALTGALLDVADAELDHKVPRSRGGTSDLTNLQWTTRAANRAKHTLTVPEFRALCASVAGWRPC